MLQYWGERYGPQAEIDLEQRVADYLRALTEMPSSVGLTALGRSIDYDYGSGIYPSDVEAPDRAMDAFREFLVASYMHAADNADDFPQYQLRDELISHAGAVVGSLPNYPATPELQLAPQEFGYWRAEEILAGRAKLYPVDLPADAATAAVSLSGEIDLSDGRALRLALVRERTTAGERIVHVSTRLMASQANLPPWESWAVDGIDVDGWDRLTVIVVGAPNGSWTYDLRVSTASAPAPVAAASEDSVQALTGSLEIGADRQAGVPLVMSLSLEDAGGPITEATAVATINAPGLATHRVYLADEGLNEAGMRDDGRFAAISWATADAGSYPISVHATGTGNDGLSFDEFFTTSVTVAASPDTDGDGVVDMLEQRLELDPADPADGILDHDGDGLSLAADLAAGSSPARADTDRGGESDASEAAAGLDPGDPDDDRAVPSLLVGGVPRERNRIEAYAVPTGPTAQIELFRVNGNQRISLGTFPGTGPVVVEDGPLPDGEYSYAAVATAATGARSTPYEASRIAARSDPTPPITRIMVNEGRWDTSSTVIPVRFVDLSEPVVEYRLATSPEGLETAAWQPFTSVIEHSIGTALGQHQVHVQVRDAAGNISEPTSGVVFLIDTDRPTITIDSVFAVVYPPPPGGCDPCPPDQFGPNPGNELTVDVRGAASHPILPVLGAEVRLFGVRADGSRELMRDWVAATATDGAFDASSEAWFSGYGPQGDVGYVWVDVEARTTIDGQSATASERVLVDRDTMSPDSNAGPVPATSAGSGISVPVSVSDNRPGILGVELWHRHRGTGASGWGTWLRGPTASGPTGEFSLSVLFGAGDGEYQFYSVAVDAAGNRELPPTTADAFTVRDDINDPPMVSGSFNAVRSGSSISVSGSGTAADDRSNVSVTWALYGIKANGHRQRIFNFTPATAVDGAFDEQVEGYTASDTRAYDSAHVRYEVEVKVTAGGSSTQVFTVPISGP